MYGVFEIVKNLKLKTDFGAEYAYVNDKQYEPTYYIDSNHLNDSTNYMNQNINKYVRWNWENTLTYNFSVNRHHVVTLIGMTRFKEYSEGMWSQKRELIFDDLDHAYFDNAQNNTAQTTGGFSEHTLASLFARLNYNFDEKYILFI